MIKTLFLHQDLLHLGLENFFTHIKKRSKLFFFYFPNLGGTSDRPCQLIIFPIEKSLHEFFCSNFSGARIFFSVSPARFLLPPPPSLFLWSAPNSRAHLRGEERPLLIKPRVTHCFNLAYFCGM
jgi:hypothetical protein